MAKLGEKLRVMGGAAAISCAAVLVCAYPATGQADGPEAALAQQEAIPADATKIGALLAYASLVQDEQVRGRWYLELKVQNTTKEGAESAEIEACLEKTVFNMMARGAPPPTVAWTVKEKVEVGPGKVATRRIRLPGKLAWQVHASSLPPKQDASGMPVNPVSTSFSVRVMDPAEQVAAGPDVLAMAQRRW
jgi:hypothetical protein